MQSDALKSPKRAVTSTYTCAPRTRTPRSFGEVGRVETPSDVDLGRSTLPLAESHSNYAPEFRMSRTDGDPETSLISAFERFDLAPTQAVCSIFETSGGLYCCPHPCVISGIGLAEFAFQLTSTYRRRMLALILADGRVRRVQRFTSEGASPPLISLKTWDSSACAESFGSGTTREDR